MMEKEQFDQYIKDTRSILDEINGAVCLVCNRVYPLAELDALPEDAELAPCGHRWGHVFDCVIEAPDEKEKSEPPHDA